MTLGERLIAEIARQGHLGRYFDDRGYERLSEIDAPETLQAFLSEWGFERVSPAQEPARLARELACWSPALAEIPLVTFAVGTAMGAVSVVFATLLIPASADSYDQVTTLLVQNLGIIFPLLLGFWAGYVQQSLRGIFVGVTLGALVGGLHRCLCAQSLWIAMPVYPLLLCGLIALGFGRRRPDGSQEAGARLGKGLLVGGATVGTAFLLVVMARGLPSHLQALKPTMSEYRQAIGLFTLGISPCFGALLVVIHWATGLKHPHWGPWLMLSVSYRTAGLDRIQGDPQQAWQEMDAWLRREDASYRRGVRRLGWAVAVLVVAWLLIHFLGESLVSGLPPYLAIVAHRLLSLDFFVYVVGFRALSAALQRYRNVRIGEELQRYPPGTTLAEIQRAEEPAVSSHDS